MLWGWRGRVWAVVVFVLAERVELSVIVGHDAGRSQTPSAPHPRRSLGGDDARRDLSVLVVLEVVTHVQLAQALAEGRLRRLVMHVVVEHVIGEVDPPGSPGAASTQATSGRRSRRDPDRRSAPRRSVRTPRRAGHDRRDKRGSAAGLRPPLPPPRRVPAPHSHRTAESRISCRVCRDSSHPWAYFLSWRRERRRLGTTAAGGMPPAP